jgi:Tfp pilus assembly protein PilX
MEQRHREPAPGDRRRREGGAALLVAMMLLTAMALIGFASLNTVMRDREITGYSSQSQTALQGADAALAHSLDVIRTQIVGTAVAAGDCLGQPVPTATLPNGVNYGPDATAPTNLICMLAAAEPCAEIDSSIEVGQPIYLYTVWNLRTQGVSPGGATSRLQATAERCHAFNN